MGRTGKIFTPREYHDLIGRMAKKYGISKYYTNMLEGGADDLGGRDPYTGLLNRNSLFQELGELIAWSCRGTRKNPEQRKELSGIWLDIDNFKDFNDIYGHDTGNVWLSNVAEIIEKTANRPLDVASRYGGEEFVVILPETTVAVANIRAKKIRERVEKRKIDYVNEPGQTKRIGATISGVVGSVQDEKIANQMDIIYWRDFTQLLDQFIEGKYSQSLKDFCRYIGIVRYEEVDDFLKVASGMVDGYLKDYKINLKPEEVLKTEHGIKVRNYIASRIFTSKLGEKCNGEAKKGKKNRIILFQEPMPPKNKK